MEEKIEQLEEEIKKLHYSPVLNKHSFSEIDTKVWFPEFWNFHIKPVIECSKRMAKKYGADFESVWLGAMLHDIARLNDENPHDEIGANKAYDLLVKKGFDEKLAQKVKDIVLVHRCRKFPPETLEQKIVATSDAMAHFLPPFYIWISKRIGANWKDMMEGNIKKIERDFNEKIFFEDEKEAVRKEYEVLKKWFEYKT